MQSLEKNLAEICFIKEDNEFLENEFLMFRIGASNRPFDKIYKVLQKLPDCRNSETDNFLGQPYRRLSCRRLIEKFNLKFTQQTVS